MFQDAVKLNDAMAIIDLMETSFTIGTSANHTKYYDYPAEFCNIYSYLVDECVI